MANVFHDQIIYLDTFTSIIDFKALYPNGLKVKYIEWTKPTTLDHTCTILLTPDGPSLIEWQCIDVGQRFINFYNGEHFGTLYIDVSGVSSGAVFIKI